VCIAPLPTLPSCYGNERRDNNFEPVEKKSLLALRCQSLFGKKKKKRRRRAYLFSCVCVYLHFLMGISAFRSNDQKGGNGLFAARPS
jgi:hypothetical protein